jgi:hypothetical protein
MINRLSRIGGATIIGLGLVAAVNVSPPATTPVSYTADLQLTTNVLAIGGLGYETVDPELIAKVLGNLYADVTCKGGGSGTACIKGVPWPGKVTPLQGSIDEGLVNMDKEILDQWANDKEDDIVVAGASAGTLVVNQEMQSLWQRYQANPNDPTLPPPDKISFVVLGDADRSMLRKLQGVPMPLITYTVHPVPVTPYNVTVQAGEYDGLGDWPDRTWNLLADLNALAGTSLLQQVLPEQIVTALKLDAFGSVHYDSFFLPLSDAKSVTVTYNAAGGKTTTYLMPTADLPLLRPLKPLGVPQPVIDALTAVLRPIIDSAYIRNDPVNPKPAPGHTGTTVTQSVAAQSATANTEAAAAPSATASARPARAAKAAKAAAKPAGSVRRAARASAAN